jgi:hypothetical protein
MNYRRSEEQAPEENRMYRSAMLAIFAVSQIQAATFFGPTPYLSPADRPSAFSAAFTYSYLEDFEDHALNTPGVLGNGAAATLSGFSGSIIDSVDSDDGALDGSCLNTSNQCDSYFRAVSPMRFEFNAGVLGLLPTHVGIVWTDGNNNITVSAFGANGLLLGTINGSHAGGGFNNDVSEDRFYGVIEAGGISAIEIANPPGIEVDHLFYGNTNADNPIPEPATYALVGSVLAVAVAARRLARR